MAKDQLAFERQDFLVIDQEAKAFNSLFEPFVYTDLLTTIAGKEQQAFIHFWQLDQTVILGMKDTRLKKLVKGLKVLKTADFQPVVRNSGGLAVVSDQGVLNATFIFSKSKLVDASVDYIYEQIHQLIAFTFPTVPIDAYEIKDSYCPGTFDLSINGKKFAGCAQRRVKDGIAIMIYISVTGDQKERGNLIKNFYEASFAKESSADYPEVNPDSMANLADLLHEPLDVTKVKNKLLRTLEKHHSKLNSITFTQLLNQERKKIIANNRQKMALRNEILFLEEEQRND